jgi:hypothetical protein
VSYLNNALAEFKKRNGCDPEEIALSTIALAALAVRDDVKPLWNGIKVVSRPFTSDEVVEKDGKKLGVFVRATNVDQMQLESCDLK